MAYVRCSSCGFGMADTLFARGGSANCSTCGKEVHATLLPALYKGPGTKPPPLAEDPPGPGESACFYNPNRRATKVCDHCGVFMSDAWAAKWGRQTVCLKCIEDLRSKHKDTRFEAKRTLWDNVALFLATGPWVLAGLLVATFILYGFAVLVLIATLATAPAAVFVALRYWNAPRSLVPRSRARLVWGLGLGLIQIGLWTAGILALATQWSAL